MVEYVKLNGCPLCGHNNFVLVYDLETPVVRCEECDLLFLNPQPRVSHQEFYDESYYYGTSTRKNAEDNENVLNAEKIVNRLESCRAVVDLIMRHQPDPGRWLDIGCGPGFLLSQAKERGWRCTGLDSSPFAPKFARERFGLEDVHSGLIEDASFEKGSFDVISMQHVIEHLYEPVSTMREVADLLKPGGLLYLETPDICSGSAKKDGPDWLHIKIPEHVLYFSEQTIRLLLKKIGCEVVEVRHPVPGTGLMNSVCGGKEEAKKFYEFAKKLPGFESLVRMVRKCSAKAQPEKTEHIHVLARKLPD